MTTFQLDKSGGGMSASVSEVLNKAADQEPRIKIRLVGLDHEVAAEKLAECFISYGRHVHLDGAGHGKRSHLRLHKDRQGYFVRRGVRGRDKEYLGRCKVTWLNDEPTPLLVQFTLRSNDEADAAYQARLDAQYEVLA